MSLTAVNTLLSVLIWAAQQCREALVSQCCVECTEAASLLAQLLQILLFASLAPSLYLDNKSSVSALAEADLGVDLVVKIYVIHNLTFLARFYETHWENCVTRWSFS